MTGQGINAMLAAVLLALGVTTPLAPFVGGMAIALGCCFGVMSARPLESRRSVWLSLFMGALAALLAAVLHPGTASVWLWGELPLQVQMALAGGLSQALFETVIAFGSALAARAGKLPGEWRFPGTKDGG